MPYKKKGTYSKRSYRRRNASATSPKRIKSIIRAEIRKDDRKDHPLQWVDVNFTGDYVKTTPSLLSFGNTIRNNIANTQGYYSWPARYDGADTGITYKEANVFITGYHYQLRFQQNSEASGDITTTTVRDLFYSFDDTYAENTNPVLDGGDIDRAPDTRDIVSMFSDKMRTLYARITETSGDDSQFVPGQAVLKGTKKLNHKLKMTWDNQNSVSYVEGNDVRHEMQSDDNSLIGHLQVYGFIRIYYRVLF